MRQHYIGRAFKENKTKLTEIFNNVYGNDWEIIAREKLSKKGIDDYIT